MSENNIEYVIMYDLEEQVEDLAKVTGLGKHVIRRLLKSQRVLIQDKYIPSALSFGIICTTPLRFTP